MSNNDVQKIDINLHDDVIVSDGVIPKRPNRDYLVRGRVLAFDRKVGSTKPIFSMNEISTKDMLRFPREFKKVVDTSNLNVYRGRSMMMARMFGKDFLEDTPTEPFIDMKNDFVCFFAVGTGGCDVQSPLEPNKVNATDYELIVHGTTTGATRNVTINGRNYHSFDVGYPQYLADEEVINNQSILDLMDDSDLIDTVPRDAYLITKVRCTLTSAEANSNVGTQNINEVGIFLAPSNTTNSSYWASYTKHLNLFAKSNFATIQKTSQRELSFSWYIYW